MKKLFLVFALLCCSTQVMAADPCTSLQGNGLTISGSGASGTIGPINCFGNHFISVLKGTSDTVVGSCTNGNLEFTRVHQGLPGSFTQHFVGLFLLGNSKAASGVFTDTRMPAGTSPWSATLNFNIAGSK